MYAYIYVYYIFIYLFMSICMYVCMYTYLHTYIHTYIHTYRHRHIHTCIITQSCTPTLSTFTVFSPKFGPRCHSPANTCNNRKTSDPVVGYPPTTRRKRYMRQYMCTDQMDLGYQLIQNCPPINVRCTFGRANPETARKK